MHGRRVACSGCVQDHAACLPSASTWRLAIPNAKLALCTRSQGSRHVEHERALVYHDTSLGNRQVFVDDSVITSMLFLVSEDDIFAVGALVPRNARVLHLLDNARLCRTMRPCRANGCKLVGMSGGGGMPLKSRGAECGDCRSRSVCLYTWACCSTLCWLHLSNPVALQPVDSSTWLQVHADAHEVPNSVLKCEVRRGGAATRLRC